jgi:molybdopterin synthase catalytic subunit
MGFLTRDPIDTAAMIAMTAGVRTDASGALALFVGVVRAEESAGRRLLALEYEAYPEMAEAQMAAVAAEMRRRWPVEGLAMVHRLGWLAVGEASVAVAVACGHRGEAFEACRFGIDTIKKVVPIWKKEVFSDGATSWVLPPEAAPSPEPRP